MGSRDKPNRGGSGQPFSRLPKNKIIKKSIRYGAIKTKAELEEYLSHDLIVCLICGGEFKSLGHHVRRAHLMSSKEYKIQFNIPTTTSLAGKDLQERKKALSKEQWESNPKMVGVRELLKESGKHLNDFSHRTKSTNPDLITTEALKKGRLKQSETDRVKYRAIYLEVINEALDANKTLYAIKKHITEIYAFAKRWPLDAEYLEKLKQVKHSQDYNAREKRGDSGF